MAVEIKLPQMSMMLSEGTLTRWLKRVGDYVEENEPVAEIEEEKVSGTAKAPGSGYLLKIFVREDETVPVLTPIGMIGTMEELEA